MAWRGLVAEIHWGWAIAAAVVFAVWVWLHVMLAITRKPGDE